MSFSRDDVVAYEKQAPVEINSIESAAAALEAKNVVPEPAETQVAAEGSSPETAAEPAATGIDGSLDANAESSAAPADPDGVSQAETPVADGRQERVSAAQERISELVTERNALRKYGEYLLEQVNAAKAQTVKTDSAAPVTATPIDDSAPTLEGHNFDPTAFAKAQNTWLQRQVQKGIQAEIQNLQFQQSQQNVRQNFETKVSEFRKTHSDFDVVVGNPALPPLGEGAAKIVIQSDIGPAITYHLATNPDLATRIAKMGPVEQAAAIGRLEAKLEAPPTAPAPSPVVKRTVTQAPPPPKPVTNSAAVVQGEPQTMAEFVAREREQKLAEKDMRRKMRLAMR